jgi:hypothetical protein
MYHFGIELRQLAVIEAEFRSVRRAEIFEGNIGHRQARSQDFAAFFVRQIEGNDRLS